MEDEKGKEKKRKEKCQKAGETRVAANKLLFLSCPLSQGDRTAVCANFLMG